MDLFLKARVVTKSVSMIFVTTEIYKLRLLSEDEKSEQLINLLMDKWPNLKDPWIVREELEESLYIKEDLMEQVNEMKSENPGLYSY